MVVVVGHPGPLNGVEGLRPRRPGLAAGQPRPPAPSAPGGPRSPAPPGQVGVKRAGCWAGQLHGCWGPARAPASPASSGLGQFHDTTLLLLLLLLF